MQALTIMLTIWWQGGQQVRQSVGVALWHTGVLVGLSLLSDHCQTTESDYCQPCQSRTLRMHSGKVYSHTCIYVFLLFMPACGVNAL